MRNFEKNIRSAADSFKMEPAEGSFDQVMNALEKKKKRRFLFWLWFLIPGILMAAGWMGISEISKDRITALRSSQTHILVNYNPADQNQVISNPEKSSATIDNTGYTTNIHKSVSDNSVGSSKKDKTKTVNSTTYKSEKNPDFDNKNEVTNAQHSSTVNNYSSTDPITTDPISEGAKNQYIHTTAINSMDTKNELNGNNVFYSDQKANKNGNKITVTNNTVVMLPFASNAKRIFSVLPPFKYTAPFNKSRSNSFSIGAYAQVGVMKNIFINNRDSSSESYTSNRRETDKYLFSWTSGISFRYSPKPWLSIETGVGYSRYSSVQNVGVLSLSSSSTQDIETADSVYTFGNIQNTILPSAKEEYTNEYDFLSIPFKVYFQKKWNWIGIEGGIGLTMDIPVYTRSFAVQPDNNLSTFTNRVPESKLVLGLQVSSQVHAVFHISMFSIYAGPVFKMRATSMYTNDYSIRQHYYFIGAETGIRYNF